MRVATHRIFICATALISAATIGTPALADSDSLNDKLKQATQSFEGTHSSRQDSRSNSRLDSRSNSRQNSRQEGTSAAGLGALGGAAALASGSALGGNAALLQGLGLGKLTSGAAGNAAGVLEYCVKNNYLQKANIDTVKNSLLDKAGINAKEPETDASYQNGLQGMLKGDASTLDLSSVQDDVKEKACEYVLDNASSIL